MSNMKIVLIGASTLLGRELNDVLGESSFSSARILLMDDDQEAAGQLEIAGDEASFIQTVDPDAFQGADYTFFACPPDTARRYYAQAHAAGSSVIDLSGGLEGLPGVLVTSQWVETELRDNATPAPDLNTPAIVPAHSAAVALALLMGRLRSFGPIHSAAATVLEPASQYGAAAIDELHQQTVSLMNFSQLPQKVYDTQVAFNAVSAFGEESGYNLTDQELRIRRHFDLLRGGQLPETGVQLLHLPVFHGYGISLYVDYDRAPGAGRLLQDGLLEAAFQGNHFDLELSDVDAPSNIASAGQAEIIVRVRPAEKATAVWVWAGFDNLKFASLNAIACAEQLRRLRPQGQVQ